MSYFSVSFCSTLLSPGTAVSTMIEIFAFFLSELQCLASCGGFHGLLYVPILFYAFGGILIPFFTVLNSIFLAYLLMYDRPTTSCLFLYSVCASLGKLHKICCTVSSKLPHILHLDDTFWFSILAFTVFVLSPWSCAAKKRPFFLLLQFISSYAIPGNTR